MTALTGIEYAGRWRERPSLCRITTTWGTADRAVLLVDRIPTSEPMSDLGAFLRKRFM